jgi:hypothetical protein
MEFLKGIGIAGFLFFFIKGILWLALFALVYFGLVRKEKIQSLKSKITFWKKKNEN